MPAPSSLAIATSALNRLVKEEASYHKEYDHQQASIAKLEKDLESGASGADENAEFTIKQQKRALDETKAIFPQLKVKIQEAKSKLESQLEQSKDGEDGTSVEDVNKAKEAIAAALHALREVA